MRFPVLNLICLTRKAHFSFILTGDGLRMYLFYLTLKTGHCIRVSTFPETIMVCP